MFLGMMNKNQKSIPPESGNGIGKLVRYVLPRKTFRGADPVSGFDDPLMTRDRFLTGLSARSMAFMCEDSGPLETAFYRNCA